MYYSVDFYPELPKELSASIDAIRREYDPSWQMISPHVTICFPATASLDRQMLVRHVDQVAGMWNPFRITLGGVRRTPDHWLLIILSKGAEEVRRLNSDLYTGYLESYRKKPGQPGYGTPPHIGLGHFLKSGCAYDWRHPVESDFDAERYQRAMGLAEALPLPAGLLLDKVHISAIPDVVTEWTTGKRATPPEEVKIVTVHEIPLGKR